MCSLRKKKKVFDTNYLEMHLANRESDGVVMKIINLTIQDNNKVKIRFYIFKINVKILHKKIDISKYPGRPFHIM